MQNPTVTYPVLEMADWGRTDYATAFRKQKALVEDRISGAAPDRLVLVEHPPVITLGRSAGADDIRVPGEVLRNAGIDVVQTDRGGKATYHGPGQLVAYPVVALKDRDLHRFVERMLEVVSRVLIGFGLFPEKKKEQPGIWINGAKIASLGIAVRRWITYHGVSLNVNTDLAPFGWIVPCGHPRERVTSIAHLLGHSLDMQGVKNRFMAAFREIFGYHTIRNTAAKHPPWLVRPAPDPATIEDMEARLERLRLSTVCRSARCPNIGECFGRGTATFMILGAACTRACGFCAVGHGIPLPADPGEPERVSLAAETLKLDHVVLTSVTRDDLPDGGAGHFADTISRIRRRCPGATVEALVPDFQGRLSSLQKVCDSRVDVFNHNMETVKRLYPAVRLQADYRRSLGVLEHAARQGLSVKSGIMLGLGETDREVIDTISDIRRTGCRYVTIGQYLRPSPTHLPVVRFVPPEEFDRWAETARKTGFKGVASAPLVRSSYRAEEMFKPEYAFNIDPGGQEHADPQEKND